MNHGSLFSGIGGFDLAAKWMGWNNIFHCEINTFCQTILKHHFPESLNYEDITKTDFSIFRRRIDILSGGFPCQPYSSAGKRKGKNDSRHLWPEMLRAIREIQPRYILGENVLGLVNWSKGLVFNEIKTDLENEGYEVLTVILPACSVNAPHRRDRIWFIAYNNKFRRNGDAEQIENRQNSKNKIRFINFCKEQGWNEIRSFNKGSSKNGRNVTYSYCNGFNRSDFKNEINSSEGGKYAQCNIEQMGANDVTNTISIGGNENEWRPNGKPNEHDKTCAPGTWQNFPTQSPICSGDDGISSRLDGITFSKWRNESIKAAGNAVVPQLVYKIFQTIKTFDNVQNQKLQPKKS